MPFGLPEHAGLLELARGTVASALSSLKNAGASGAAHGFSASMPREVQAAADMLMNDEILTRLNGTRIPVLSEETGETGGFSSGALRWVVDPLDGTVNFVRGLAPCAVSIALYDGDRPVFGVIGEHPSGRIAWGGPGIGAFIDDAPISVSTVSVSDRAVLCTGFPARFDFGAGGEKFLRRAGSFGKVRMLGAASLSLLHVARGAADAYSENEIMLWDAGAGIAIVLGAGGIVEATAGSHHHSLNVFAHNGRLPQS